MVDQLYTNARTDTYKHPSRYVRAAVGIGRGARSGWVGAEQRALTSGAGVRAISSGNREGCAQRMGRIGVADGSERDTDGAGWDVGWVGAEQRALTSGVGAPLFGKIDTYGWDGARLIQWESYVWLGRPVESKPPPEGCTL